MISSDIRTEARRNLAGKWGKVAISTLIFAIIMCVISGIGNLFRNEVLSAIYSVVILVIEVPLTFGFVFALYKIFKNEEVEYLDFFTLGFGNFKKSWEVAINTLVKLILPLILLIVSIVLIIVGGVNMPTTVTHFETEFASYTIATTNGANPLVIIGTIGLFAASIWLTIRGFLYVLANYLVYDNLELKAKEAVETSEKLMKGNRGRLFILYLTFIGWMILAIFTLGIGYLWLAPYMQFAVFVFYKDLINSKNTTNQETIQENAIESND